jgi:SAM-dependent methyltransferase
LAKEPSPETSPAVEALEKAYNDVAYTSFPNPASHPDRLAMVATLLGLEAAPVATCRVLELACGDGINLVPVAATLPDASFVGIDFAARPIGRAQRLADNLGLTNIRLAQLDLREIPADLGKFDYVVAHGLYSWVPDEVRRHIMPLIARHLAPKGVAFVSYNTLPGCHVRRAVWEMLKYHTRAITDLPARLAAARSFLALVSVPVAGEDAIQAALREEVRHVGQGSDATLAHDDMSEPNNPFYFHEFMEDAARSGLTFLAESTIRTMMGSGMTQEVRQAMGKLDRLAREQYLDFAFFRRYRESLLCHADALSRFVAQPSRVLGMHAVLPPDLRYAGGATERPDDGTEAAALQRFLSTRWPNSVPVAELGQWRASAKIPAADGKPQQSLDQFVTELYATGALDLRMHPVAAATRAGARPEAFAAARFINREQEVIPNLYHEGLRHQGPLGQKLLALLDGTRTRDELLAAMGDVLSVPNGRAQLEEVLAVLARKALLVA